MPKQVAKKPKKGMNMEALTSSLEKLSGVKGILKQGGYEKREIISFGYPEVDEASYCSCGGYEGGVGRGNLIEIFGNPSGGKSFLTLKLIGSAQKQGLRCCLVDAEQSFDPKWAEKHGVDADELFRINEPMSAEKLLDAVVTLCSSGLFGLVVIDSVAALVPVKELEGSVTDQDYALKARAMSKACPKIIAAIAATKTTCVFINQIREKMNVMFGSPETTPGGRSLPFYAHQRIQVTPGQIVRLKDGKKDKNGKEAKGTPIGRKSYVKFVKNKTAPPFGECIIEIIFNEAALNPVVMLCNRARSLKLIGIRNGIFQIKKTITGGKKNLITDTTSIAELADYIVKNDMVMTILEASVEAIEEINDEVGKDEPALEEKIMDMQEDPSLIKSPIEGKELEVEVVNKKEDIVDDIRNDDEVEPEVEPEV